MSMLSPLDMLFMSSDEQKVLRCLNRQPRQSLTAIADVTGIPHYRLEELLELMVNDSHLVEQYKDGQRTFSVRFARAQERVRNMPLEMLALFEQQPDTFLAEVPLTAVLTDLERETLLSKAVTRPVLVDEVCIWQGKPFRHVGLVRTGLLKKSRLQGYRAARSGGEYLRRYDWFGLTEALCGEPSPATYTAVTEGEMLLWSTEFFLDFVRKHPHLSMAVNQMLAQAALACQTSQGSAGGRLWVVEGLDGGAGATTVAARLALQARTSGDEPQRVLLWNATGRADEFAPLLGRDLAPTGRRPTANYRLEEHASGIDVLSDVHEDDYPAQVLLDMLLADFQARYDYIICDAGTAATDELTLRLRAQAQTLITLTDDPNGAARATAYWNRQPFARPAQKRLLVLNRTTLAPGEADLSFQLVIAADDTVSAETPAPSPTGTFHQTLAELIRRLSLTHTIGIFIPSTLDVDQAVDNAEQVKDTLAFLGAIFGGATSSDAEGVWRSEDSGLVVEQVTVVRTFVSKQAMETHLDAVIEFATDLKRAMRQEAVALDVDNQLLLV